MNNIENGIKDVDDTIGELKENFDDFETGIENVVGTNVITLTHGYYIKTNASPVNLTPQANASFNLGGYALVPCSAGDKFIINGAGAVSGRLWCFIKSDNTIITNAMLNVRGQNLELVAPEESVYCIINSTENAVSYQQFKQIEVDIDNVLFANPNVSNAESNIGTGWTYSNGVYTCNYTGTSRSWFYIGIDINNLIENVVVVNANVFLSSGSEFFVGLFGKKTTGSVFVAYAQIVSESGVINSAIDLNYYAIYEDLDLTKPIHVGVGNYVAPCSGTVSDFSVTTNKYLLDKNKPFYKNINDMIVAIKSNQNSIANLNAEKYLIAPNGTKYRTVVANDGSLLTRPVIPNKTLFIGNSLLLGNGLFGMCASAIDKDYYYYVTQALIAKNANATYSRIWGRDFEWCTTVADAESWMTNVLRPQLSQDIDLVVVQLGDNVANATMKDVFETTCAGLIEFIKANIPGVDIAWAGAYFTSERVQNIISNACAQTGAKFISFSSINRIGAGIGAVINYGKLGTRQYEITSYTDDATNKIVTVEFTVAGNNYTASVPYESYSVSNNVISIYGTYGYAKTSAVGSHPSDETMLEIGNLMINALGFN